MSAPRCGYCGAPTLNGSLCKRDWGRLRELLLRCDGMEGDLGAAAAKQGRHGEEVRGSTAPGVPVNFAAVGARRALYTALSDALGRIGATAGAGTVDSAAAAILTRSRAVLASFAGPALLGDLETAVPRAVETTDKPRRRPGVNTRCPRCGQLSFLPVVMGSLECSCCRERMSIAEVRDAA